MTIYRLTISAAPKEYGFYYLTCLASLETADSTMALVEDLCNDQMYQEAAWYEKRAQECRPYRWDEFLSSGNPDYIDLPTITAADKLRKRGLYLEDIRRQVERGRPFVFHYCSIVS
jgi:hypothetical protein